jgi:formylglycine-generating enzyme required for sulfatase activity
MEPLSTMLLGSFIAAAGALAGGVGEAAGGDAWAVVKGKLNNWLRLDERQRQRAFDRVLQRDAIPRFRQVHPNRVAVEQVLVLLADNSPEGQAFRQAAVEEFLFSVRPNIGRLLDLYRRDVRFAAVLRGQELLAWTKLEPALTGFFQTHLWHAMAHDEQLRPLLLEQAELQLLDAQRAATAAAADSAATLLRIETLLGELLRLPRIAVTFDAGDDTTVQQSPQTVVLGNYYQGLPLVSPLDLDALYRSYRAFLVETYGRLDFRGIMQMQNVVRLRLEEVYVPLRGQHTTRGELVQDGDAKLLVVDEAHRSGWQFREQRSTTSLHMLVRDQPFLVVLGDPGAGKSTLVKYVLLALAEGMAAARLGLADEWLPILFPVAAFAQAREQHADLVPLDYLSQYYQGLSQPDYGPLFRRALLAGRALVLLDGLDEVRAERLELTRCLEAFVREWDAPGNRFVATSRIAGYDDAPLDDALFTRVTVQTFDDDDIRLFAQQWSLAYERAGVADHGEHDALVEAELHRRADARALSLSDAIFASEGVTDLARNPLLLTILALIHNQGTRLPDRRVDLYRLCVEALAETWNRARSLSGREIDAYLGDEKLDERFVVNLLGPAALWIHAEQPGGLVEQRDLEQQLVQTLVGAYGQTVGKAQGLAREFIELVRRHTGLLQERGHRRYGFLHLTLEEYLAARAILDSATIDDPDALIHERCVDPGWREVLRLMVASASQREAQRLLLHILAKSTTEAARGRPVVLAGECLLDVGRGGATSRAERAVIYALVTLLADPTVSIQTRVEGGHLLGQLGDPRLLDAQVGDAPSGSYWCRVERGLFWTATGTAASQDEGEDDEDGDGDEEQLRQVDLPYDYKIARFPVTNAEFARFIADDGYNPQQLWWTEQGRAFLAPGGQPYDDQEWITLPRYWSNAKYNNPIQPVVGVSWYEAAAYAAWLTMQGHTKGWLAPNDEIRLPTWLEWERAARYTDQRRYPWGDVPPTPEHANYGETNVGTTSPVGCFPLGAAVCGTLDMAGNTYEWTCTDAENEQRPSKDFTPDRYPLISWSYFGDSPNYLRCGARRGYSPYNWYNGLGFRIVWSPRSSV